MDINEIIKEEGEEEQGQKEFLPYVKPGKRINKKIFFIIPVLIVLILGVFAYLFLYKSSMPNVITGPGGKAVFPPVVQNQFINKLAAVSKPPVRAANNTPIISNTKVNSNSTSLKEAKKQGVVKAGKPKAGAVNNTLNDLFTVKYKHKAKKANMPVNSNMPSYANVPNVPAVPFNQNLPNFNLKSMEAKVKNAQGISGGNSFNASGYSGGYVIVECGKNTKYLKAGDSACGYTLLKADESGATFSYYGKFKKITY